MSVSCSSVTLTGSLQSLQTRRARRWATIAFTEAVTKNGSTPMLSRRETVEGASFVCSVDSTK